ncbi:MAG: DUF2809 domain-containing protein [Deltaproteobacteria bacterium]|nr:DUF2809 domain-containing protein [Deltaproteobacteria bacterium]
MGRPAALGAALFVIVIGLVTRRFPVGVRLWDHDAGEALYAAMVALFVVLVRPSLRGRTVLAIALGLCTALEAFQATGIPARSPRVIRFLLGATFAWSDLACYAVGAAAIAALHTWRSGATGPIDDRPR